MRLRKGLKDLPIQLRQIDFVRMEGYLRGWLAKVATHQPDEQAGHDEKWRKRRVYRVLKVCKEQKLKTKLDQVLAQRYGATILLELTDDQLGEVFQMICAWE